MSVDGQLLEEAPMPGQVTTVASVAALPGRRLAVAGRAADSGFLLASLDGDNMVEAEAPAGLGEPTLLQHQGKQSVGGATRAGCTGSASATAG